MQQRKSKSSAFIGVSLAVHLSVFFALETAALRPEKPKLKSVQMAIRHNEPPPPPPPPPEPPKKKIIEVTKKVEVVKKAEPPPPEQPPTPPPPPMFGVSLSSTTADSNFAVRVGNTTMAEQGKYVEPKAIKPMANPHAPVSIAQLTKKPTPNGSCPPFDPSRLYTQVARDQEIEGRVELEVTIDEEGKVTDVRLKHGLGYGLDEAAISTLQKHCKFNPAEVNGEKVVTKINYAFTFVLPD